MAGKSYPSKMNKFPDICPLEIARFFGEFLDVFVTLCKRGYNHLHILRNLRTLVAFQLAWKKMFQTMKIMKEGHSNSE